VIGPGCPLGDEDPPDPFVGLVIGLVGIERGSGNGVITVVTTVSAFKLDQTSIIGDSCFKQHGHDKLVWFGLVWFGGLVLLTRV
jgi:hypothetical protein